MGPEVVYKYEYKLYSNPTWTTATTTNLSVTISGLGTTSSSYYDFRLSAIKDGGELGILFSDYDWGYRF